MRITHLATCGFLILGTVACNKADANQKAQGGPPKMEKVPVAVSPVKIGPATSYFATTSTLQPEARAEIRSRTTGIVRQIFKEEGDAVEKEDILLKLEDDDLKIRLEQAQIALNQAQTEYDRKQRMKEMGVLADQEFDLVKHNLEKAQADLNQAELSLSYTVITAPFSGKIVRRQVDVGANITPGIELFQIMDTDPLLLKIYLPSNRMAQIKVGQKVEIEVTPYPAFTGEISLVSPIVEEETGTVKVTAEVHQYPNGIRPGDFAKVRILTLKRDNAMLVNSSAVIEEPSGHFVYVLDGNKARKQAVELGIVESGWTEIISGLDPASQIVVKGQRNLREGSEVVVIETKKTETEAEGSKTT
ncbi:MAG: efflux RND transporter periplasmic adaptor subunit [Acidobacteria bacterium]|nr:efflux RND transporter periplasmic adaptor subunit [Acidobacteriota bacterium]MCB9398762.1 efflux RND transporter periplasmic adaptor subunit [Acidobacteriota bacterium]